MKPLYGFGGGAVFRVTRDDLNFGSLYDMFSVTFREQWVVQKFLPAFKDGDKRIILVDGEYAGAVNRIPAADDLRSNMVRGGSPAKATELTKRERRFARSSARRCASAGCLFVGIDVIGDYITEINVTSPTGIRAVKNVGGPDIAALIWDKIEAKRLSALAASGTSTGSASSSGAVSAIRRQVARAVLHLPTALPRRRTRRPPPPDAPTAPAAMRSPALLCRSWPRLPVSPVL